MDIITRAQLFSQITGAVGTQDHFSLHTNSGSFFIKLPPLHRNPARGETCLELFLHFFIATGIFQAEKHWNIIDKRKCQEERRNKN